MEQWIAKPNLTSFKSVYDRYEQSVSREVEGVFITQAMNDLVNHWRQGELQPKEHESYFVNVALPKIASRMVRTRYLNEALTTSVYLFIRKSIDIAIELMPLNIQNFADFLVSAFDHTSSFYTSKNMPPQLVLKFPKATIDLTGLPTTQSAQTSQNSNETTAAGEAQDKSAEGASIPSKDDERPPLDSETSSPGTQDGLKEGQKETSENSISTQASPEASILNPSLDEEEPDINPYASIQGTTLHYPSQFLPDLLNFFGALGGFHKLFEHINLDTTPVVNISALLNALRNSCMHGFMLKRRVSQFVEKVLSMRAMSGGLSLVQLRGSKKEELEALLRHIGFFLKNTKSNEFVLEVTDQLGLKIAEQCLSSGVITLRLFALTFIGSAIDAVIPRSNNPPASSPSKETGQEKNAISSGSATTPTTTSSALNATSSASTQDSTRWLNTQNLIAWIKQSHILQNLFGDSTHSQLLKNCGKLVRFLAQNDGISIDDVLLMWNCGSSSYESLANDAMNVFFDIVGFLPSDRVEPIIQLLDNHVNQALNYDALMASGASHSPTQTTNEANSEQISNSNAHISSQDLHNIASLANRVSDASQRMRLVHLLLNIFDASGAHILQDSLPHLIDIFRSEWFMPHRLEVMSIILKKLQDDTHPNKSFYCSLLDPILATWMSDADQSQKAMEWIHQQIGMRLEDFLIDELVAFKESCKPLVNQDTYGYSDGLVLAGCTTYIQEIQNRAHLLYHLFTNGQGRLTQESALRLWDTLYQHALNFGEAEEAAVWFRAAASSHSLAIPPALAFHIFQERLVHLDFSQMSPGLYNCFELFFVHANSVMQTILPVTTPQNSKGNNLDFEVATHPDKLVGEICLWDIALTNADSSVVSACMQLLVKCMENLIPSLQLEISPVELREHFIAKCLGRVPTWVEQYRATAGILENGAPIHSRDQSMLVSSSDSTLEHQYLLEKYISNALSLLVHLMDSLEPAASKRSTITRGFPMTLRVNFTLHLPLPMDPSNVLNAQFNISAHSTTTFGQLQERIVNCLDPVLKKHALNQDDLIFIQVDPWWRLDREVSTLEASLDALAFCEGDVISVIHLPSVAGRETVLRSRKPNSFKQNHSSSSGGDDRARPADAEAKIQQICDFVSDCPPALVEFALKSHGWDVQIVGDVFMDEGRRHKLFNEAKKVGIGFSSSDEQNANGSSGAAPSAKELVAIMKQRTEAVLSLGDETTSSKSSDGKAENSCSADDSSLPSIILARSKQHFDALFNLLTLNNDAISTAVWQIILRIPTSLAIKTSLLSMGEEAQNSPNWSELLPSDVYRLNYTIQIIDQILCPLDDSWALAKRMQWAKWFHQSGGLAQLFKVVSHFETGTSNSTNSSALQSLRQSVDTSGTPIPNDANESGKRNDKSGTLSLSAQMRRDCLSTSLKILDVFMTAYANSIGVNIDTIAPEKEIHAGRERLCDSSFEDITEDLAHTVYNPTTSGHALASSTSHVESALEEVLNIQATINNQVAIAEKHRIENDLIPSLGTFLAEARINLLPLDVEVVLRHIREILAWGTKSHPPVANGVLADYAWRCYVNIALSTQVNAREEEKRNEERPKEGEEEEKNETSPMEAVLSPDFGSLMSSVVLNTVLDLITHLDVEIRRCTAVNMVRLTTKDNIAAKALFKALLNSLPPIEEARVADLQIARCYSRFYGMTEFLLERNLSEMEASLPGSLFGDAVVTQYDSLRQYLMETIRDRPECETGGHGVADHVLVGSIRLLACLMKVWPNQITMGCFIEDLFHGCMFTPSFSKTGKEQTNSSSSNSSKQGQEAAQSSSNESKQEEKDKEDTKKSNSAVKVYSAPKCKTNFSRNSAYALMLALAKQSASNKTQLLKLLSANHSGAYAKMSSWDFHPGHEDKSATGYTGLVNLGATCYMNSLLQQFFMMPSLRRDLLRAPVVLGPNEALKENMVYQFHQLMGALQETAKAAHSPKEFMASYRDFEGNPADVNTQQDVFEFFNIVCGTLENSLKGTGDERVLPRNLGCVQVSQIKSCEPEFPFSSEREEDLTAIPLDVRVKNNFNDAMDLFVKQERLEGDNKYKCDQYNRHIVATKGNLIKTMSNTILFHLQRFDFDLATLRKRKLNEYFNFPMRINMKKWTTSGQLQMSLQDLLSSASNPSSNDSKSSQNNNEHRERSSHAANQLAELDLQFPEHYYEFQLTGILVHTGSADSGHYYSFIKERKPNGLGKWMQFNDRVVSEFDPNDIPQECFGGHHQVKEWDSHLGKEVWHDAPTEKNAYMLFYERVVPIELESAPQTSSGLQPSEATGEVSTSAKGEEKSEENEKSETSISKPHSGPEVLSGNRTVIRSSNYVHDVPSEVHNRVWEENSSFLKMRQIFDPVYYEFMNEFAKLWNPVEPVLHVPEDVAEEIASDSALFKVPAPSEDAAAESESEISIDEDSSGQSFQYAMSLQLAASKTITRLIFEVVAHSQNNVLLTSMLNQLTRMLSNHIPSAIWFVEYVRRNNVIKEVMLQCHIERTRIAFQDFFKQILQMLAQSQVSFVPSVITKQNRKPNSSSSASTTSAGSQSSLINNASKTSSSSSISSATQGASGTGYDAYKKVGENAALSSAAAQAQQPIPAECVLINAFLDLLEESRGAWRRFKQFFGVIRDFARIGLPQRTYMVLGRNLISIYVDYFMGQSSGGVSRTRVMDEDNFPDLVEFIDTITLMVCSCKNENPTPHWSSEQFVATTSNNISNDDETSKSSLEGGKVENSEISEEKSENLDKEKSESNDSKKTETVLVGPPVNRLQIGDLEMPSQSRQDLYSATDFFTSLLEMDYNSPSTADMCEYICWYVPERTNYVLDHLLTKIDVKPMDNKAPVLEYLLYRLLTINDDLRDHRIRRALGKTLINSSLNSNSVYSSSMMYSSGTGKSVKSLLLLAQSATQHAVLYVVGFMRLIETIPACLEYVLANSLDLLWLRKFWREQFCNAFPQASCDSGLEKDAKDLKLYLWFSAAADLVHPRHPAHPVPPTSKNFIDHPEFATLAPEPWKKHISYLALVFVTHLMELNGNKEPVYEDLVLEQEKELIALKAKNAELEKEKKTLAKALMYVHENYPSAKLQPKLEAKVEDIIRDYLFSTGVSPIYTGPGSSSGVISGSGRPITSISYLKAAKNGMSGSSDGLDGAKGMNAGANSTSPGPSSQANASEGNHQNTSDTNEHAARTSSQKSASGGDGSRSSEEARASNANTSETSQNTSKTSTEGDSTSGGASGGGAGAEGVDVPISGARTTSNTSKTSGTANYEFDSDYYAQENEEYGEEDDLEQGIQTYPPRGRARHFRRSDPTNTDEEDGLITSEKVYGPLNKDENEMPGLKKWTQYSDGMHVLQTSGDSDPLHATDVATEEDFYRMFTPASSRGPTAIGWTDSLTRAMTLEVPSDWEERINNLKNIGMCDDDDVLKALLEENGWSVESAANELFDPDSLARATRKAALQKANQNDGDAGSDDY